MKTLKQHDELLVKPYIDAEIKTRAKLGAHNIFPLTIDDLKALNTINGTWSGNSFTMYGITYNCEVTNGYISKITARGTATATSTLELFGKYAAFASNKYKGNILSGSPSGGSGTSYCIIEQTSASSAGTSPDFSRDEGSGAVIGNNDYARLYIRIDGGYAISGSLIFNPMIRLASDADTTYRPYVPTNAELLSADTNAVLGAHQLLDYDLAKLKAVNTEGTWTNNSYLIKGITFVVNNDLSVTFSGTSDASVNPLFNFISSMVLDEDVIMSDGVNADTYDYYLQATSSSTSWNTKGKSPLIPKGTTLTSMCIRVATNRTIANTTFKPLIKLASDSSTEFTPYAKTNRELTEDTGAIEPMFNVLGAKNIFDIEGWLTAVGLTYTKNGDTYTTSSGGQSYATPFAFANKDIDMVISGIISNVTSSAVRIEILNASNEVVATIRENTTYASGKGCKLRLNWTTSGNFSIEKPMIRPASIKNSEYVPYAMTNRELTENVNGKYVYTDWDKWFEVTADGTKTIAALLKELADSIVSFTQTMSSDEQMTLNLVAGDNYSAVPAITKINNASTSLTNTANGLSVGSNGSFNAVRIVISTTAANNNYVVTNVSTSGAVTVTDKTSNVPTSGVIFIVRASIYKKI